MRAMLALTEGQRAQHEAQGGTDDEPEVKGYHN